MFARGRINQRRPFDLPDVKLMLNPFSSTSVIVQSERNIPGKLSVIFQLRYTPKPKNGYVKRTMAYKCREEIVGKRFLSVRSPTKLKINKILEWEWRSGVVRAVSSRDLSSVDFTVSYQYFFLLCLWRSLSI